MVGVLDDLDNSYGWTYLAALVLGTAMLVFLLNRSPKPQIIRHAYVAAFPVIFTLMVILRFGGF